MGVGQSASPRIWNPIRDGYGPYTRNPVRIRLKQPDLRVRLKRITDRHGSVISVVLTAYDLDYNGPQEPVKPSGPKRHEFHTVELYWDREELRASPGYVSPYGILGTQCVNLMGWIEYDRSEGTFAIDNDDGSGIEPGTADEIRQWLEGEITDMEPIVPVEASPERLQAAKDPLAAYGFELIEHSWAGPNFHEIHYPASAISHVAGYFNPLNIEDVDRFLLGYAPRRKEWHRVVPMPPDE